MKPVEQGFKNYWIHEITTQSDGELPVAFSHCKPKPSIHVVEIAALRAEQEKVKELVECLIDCEDIFECEGITSLHLDSIIKKYGASNDSKD